MVKSNEKKAELIRIAGTDISTKRNLAYGLAQIKGVGFMFVNAICATLNFDKNRTIGSLSDEEVEKIENFLTNPEKKGIPSWLLNQRKDLNTGKDLHLVSKDIDFNLLQVRRRTIKLKTYKGLRYRERLPVRGQRTRSNFRRNKTLAAMKSKKTGGRK